MEKNTYTLLENYMFSCMEDSAHDADHIYRVLYNALDIAQTEKDVNPDILISACLLHDIGRKEQFENPKVSHAAAGAEKAYSFLTGHGFDEDFAVRVRDCILSHSYRKSNPAKSIEAKILFDADKIDVTGALGLARTLLYKGTVSEPLYNLSSNGQVSDGSDDENPSFFHEYKYKLEKIYEQFYTVRGAEIAAQRQNAAVDFYNNMLQEVKDTYKNGIENLHKFIK